jgi:hypothetical protein
MSTHTQGRYGCRRYDMTVRNRIATILYSPARHRKPLIVGVLCLFLGGMAVVAMEWSRPRTTSVAVRQAIEADLPMGSSAGQTVAFLVARAWLGSGDATPYPNQGVTSSDGFEQEDPEGSTLLANVPDAFPGGIVRGGIYMKFGFDADGRLTRYRVTDIYTGP